MTASALPLNSDKTDVSRRPGLSLEPHLLLACDVDGTIIDGNGEIVARPRDALPGIQESP
jgi:hypothetical protein